MIIFWEIRKVDRRTILWEPPIQKAWKNNEDVGRRDDRTKLNGWEFVSTVMF